MIQPIAVLNYFSSITDPRVKGMVIYPLEEILLLLLCGTLWGLEDIDDIEFCGNENLEFFQKYMPYVHGIPPAQTMRRVLAAINSDLFIASFEKWVADIHVGLKGVIAIDGKTIRGSRSNTKSGISQTHIVSAFAHEMGIVLGQQKVNDKSNEITAIPELLGRLLSIEGTVITIDAMGTQKEIAKLIRSRKADYILALKGNQGTLHEDVKLFFEENNKDVVWDEYEETDIGHGRIEIRRAVATEDIDWLKDLHPDWKDLKTIIKIEALRIDKRTGKEANEIRYYISSLPAKAEYCLKSIRAHWSIENQLHWILDMRFREDSCRIRIDNAPANLAIIRKTAINLLKRDLTKMTIKRKQLRAFCDKKYMHSLLTSFCVNN